MVTPFGCLCKPPMLAATLDNRVITFCALNKAKGMVIKMKKYVCLFLTFMMVIWCDSPLIFAVEENSNNQQYTITEPYLYPVTPGSDEWDNFDTIYEMIEACEIPEDMLKSMTTEALSQTVLNYPLLMDLLASNNARKGFEAMLSNFNGLRELSKRTDARDYLANEYLKLLEENNFQKGSNDPGQQIKETLAGILLQQPEFGGLDDY